MPEYTIRVWDADSFDFNSVLFVREAFKAKKWAFVADYIRLYALYTEGGIYLDSDVKVYRKFDDFLDNRFFIGTEPLANNQVEVESAIMGSEAGHPYLKKCLDFYESFHFGFQSGYDWNNCTFTCPRIMSKILLDYGYVHKDENQFLPEGIRIYSREYFGHCFGTPKGDYYAIHYFNASWLENRHGALYRFCKRNDLMDSYITISQILNKLKFSC